ELGLDDDGRAVAVLDRVLRDVLARRAATDDDHVPGPVVCGHGRQPSWRAGSAVVRAGIASIMASEKQRQAARKNVKKAQSGARSKRTISNLDSKTRFALGSK